MSFHFITLLAMATLVASIDAKIFVPTNLKIDKSVNSAPQNNYHQRFLRVDKTTISYKYSTNEEERVLVGAKLEAAKKMKALMQLNDWFNANKTPKQVFKILGLKGLGNGVFARKEFEVYKDYVRYYNKHLVPAENHLERLKFYSKWLNDKVTPEMAFKKLGLESLGSQVFITKEFDFYKSYVRFYNSRQPLILPN